MKSNFRIEYRRANDLYAFQNTRKTENLSWPSFKPFCTNCYVTVVLYLTGSLWRRQSQQSFNTLTPFNFLLYSLHVSVPTGHPQVRYTISYYFCFLKDYFNTTDPLHVCNLIIRMLFVVIGFSTYSPNTCYRTLLSVALRCARPPLWSSGQSSWLQIRRSGFDSRHYQKKSSGSGTGSTQPREYNWGATW
jgi:hypothetical protein